MKRQQMLVAGTGVLLLLVLYFFGKLFLRKRSRTPLLALLPAHLL